MNTDSSILGNDGLTIYLERQFGIHDILLDIRRIRSVHRQREGDDTVATCSVHIRAREVFALTGCRQFGCCNMESVSVIVRVRASECFVRIVLGALRDIEDILQVSAWLIRIVDYHLVLTERCILLNRVILIYHIRQVGILNRYFRMADGIFRQYLEGKRDDTIATFECLLGTLILFRFTDSRHFCRRDGEAVIGVRVLTGTDTIFYSRIANALVNRNEIACVRTLHTIVSQDHLSLRTDSGVGRDDNGIACHVRQLVIEDLLLNA